MELLILKSMGLFVGALFGTVSVRAIYASITERVELRRFMRQWNTTEGLCGWLLADHDAYHREIVRIQEYNEALPATATTDEARE